MEALQQQMASTALKQRSQQYLGFADVVGASEVSSFHQALQYSVHTDTQSLSIAGQTFNSEEARGLSITTQLQDVFLHPHKSCLALNVTYTNCYPVSSASLIESISATIGQVNVPTSQGAYYQQQLFNTMNPEEFEQYKNQLMLMKDVSKIPTIDGKNVTFTGANPAANQDPDVYGYTNLSRQLEIYAREREVGVRGNTTITVTHLIPLHFIWPALLRENAILYLGQGQKLVLNGRFLNSSICCLPMNNAGVGDAMRYDVDTSSALILCYTPLDEVRKQQVLKSQIGPLPIFSNVHNIQTAGNNYSYQFPINRGQFARKLYISMHPLLGSRPCANDTTHYDHIYDGVATKLKNKLHYSPKIPFSYISIQIGQQTQYLRSQEIKWLTEIEGDCPYENQQLKSTRSVFQLDLSRFSDEFDAMGSLSSEQSFIVVQFQVDTTDESGIMFGEDINTTALNQHFNFVVNMECMSLAQCVNGMYSMM